MEEVLKLVEPLLMLYAGKLGFLAQVVSIVGTLRLIIKPMLSILESVTLLTPTVRDDEILKKVKDSKWFKGVCYFLDWFASLKIKK